MIVRRAASRAWIVGRLNGPCQRTREHKAGELVAMRLRGYRLIMSPLPTLTAQSGFED